MFTRSAPKRPTHTQKRPTNTQKRPINSHIYNTSEEQTLENVHKKNNFTLRKRDLHTKETNQHTKETYTQKRPAITQKRPTDTQKRPINSHFYITSVEQTFENVHQKNNFSVAVCCSALQCGAVCCS